MKNKVIEIIRSLILSYDIFFRHLIPIKIGEDREAWEGFFKSILEDFKMIQARPQI